MSIVDGKLIAQPVHAASENGVKVGQMVRDRHDRKGALVQVECICPTTGRKQIYEFASHGMTPEQTSARIADIRSHHTAKASKLAAFESLQGKTFVAGGITFRVWTLTITERGTDSEVLFSLRRMEGSDARSIGKLQSILAGSIDELPSAEDLTWLISAYAAQLAAEEAAHHQFVTSVQKLVAGP